MGGTIAFSKGLRRYATVGPAMVIGRPPQAPQAVNALSKLDSTILYSVSSRSNDVDLSNIIRQYKEHSGRVLDGSLIYESRPLGHRRLKFDSNHDESSSVSLVAHCVREGEDHKITLSSGFALEGPRQKSSESLVLTCAHTLEEIRRSPLLLSESSPLTSPQSSGSFVILKSKETELSVHPVSSVLSALHRSDLLLLSLSGLRLRTLPISPYPAPPNTLVRSHFVSDRPPNEPGWQPWVGGMWSKWVQGKVLGYRDFAGRETQPGTYDALSHLLFHPVPTAGSSGGPIVDEESGAVVGIMLGTRMDNRLEGMRGWGVPSETIFEMFCLPGLEGKH